MFGDPTTLTLRPSRASTAEPAAAPFVPSFEGEAREERESRASDVRILHPRRWWYLAPAAGCPPGTAAEGPWPLTRVQAAMQAGVVESTRLVWSPGMAGWEPAGYQAEFSFEFSPPPLPAA